MAGSTFGNQFKIMTWGESHGAGVGVVIDGCPAGIPLAESDIQVMLNKRKPGQSKYTTPRKEDDEVEILSGIFEGKTTGTPISMVVRNKTQRSADYSEIARFYRPGHADYTFDAKYGIRDYRGGGRSSARETIGRVAAGAIAKKILEQLGIDLIAFTRSIGDICIPETEYRYEDIAENMLYMPNNAYAKKASDYLESCMKNQDSSGGIVECRVKGMPAGIGETVFDKLDASLAKAVVSIGAVKGVEIGDGFEASKSHGSSNNDAFTCQNGTVIKKTNHAGGILGGMSDGSELIFRAAFKPTPSISKEQQTINTAFEDTTIAITGRHDPVVVPRAVVVVESMAAITILDQMMINMSSKMDALEAFYCKE